MADEEKVIFKLELDGSGYIQGADALSASTNKFTQSQDEANKRLKQNSEALQSANDNLKKRQKDLEDYTGTNAKYRKQLESDVNKATELQVKLTKNVNETQKAYDRAAKSAKDFSEISARAAQLQAQTTGGKIPTGAPIGATSPIAKAGGLPQVVAQTKVEFDALAVSIAKVEQEMKGLDPNSAEFKELDKVLQAGLNTLKTYGAVVEQVGTKQLSLRGQMRAGQEELVKMEAAGKGATKEYFELEKKVAKLTDAYGDQQQRIKILASDTKALDFGKGAITAATSAFQAFTAVSILAGDESAELQKKTMQLFAAMQLLQSLEQLSNLTRREGVLATLAQSGAQAAYTAVVGTTTGALKTLRIAFAATGIGLAIAGIAFLITKYQQHTAALKEAAASQKLLNEVTEEAIKEATKEVVHLQLIKEKLNDLAIPQKERVKLAKEYNKTADDGNKIDLTQINNIALVNAAIDTQIKKIEERALARAAENVLVKNSEILFLATEKARAKILDQQAADIKAGKIILADGKKISDSYFAQLELEKDLIKKIANDPEVKQAQKNVDDTMKAIGSKITLSSLLSDNKNDKSDTDKVANQYAKKLAELQAKLAEVTAKSFESSDTISKQFEESLKKEILDINESKAFTPDQKLNLVKLLVDINDIQLKEALGIFSKKVIDARNKLNDDILSLQNQNKIDSINLLQDEFQKRAEIININEKNELAESKKNNELRIKELEESTLITGAEFIKAKNDLVRAGEDEQTNIQVRAAQQRQDLAVDMFKKSLQKYEEAISDSKLVNDKAALEEINALNTKFLTGLIDYEDYRKELEKIQKKYDDKSLADQIEQHEKELKELVRSIGVNLSDKEVEAREKLIKEKEAQLTGEKLQQAKGKVSDPATKQTETVVQYAESIGQLTDSIISFWQKANEAELKALDRSISLQEKRVDAAYRIATKGNAQYLKLEEDRLRELNLKRENAAKKQLAIDAALQASNVLVGITGAIAKIATPGIGIAETIGAIAVIVASLATGYGIVKSLQGNQPKLRGGTKHLRRNGAPSGTDTISAWLNEGEAVIPTEKNAAYRPAIAAIYDGTIPANHMNNFVNSYLRVKGVDQPNYSRIKDAAELRIGADGKMSVLLEENNDLQRQTLKAMKHMSVSANIDRNGVSILVNEYINQMKIDKRV